MIRMVIPTRTESERLVRAWTAPERGAIAQAIEAGRVTYALRGRSGLPERTTLKQITTARVAFRMAMRRAA